MHIYIFAPISPPLATLPDINQRVPLPIYAYIHKHMLICISL
jgi:hypothetical protein